MRNFCLTFCFCLMFFTNSAISSVPPTLPDTKARASGENLKLFSVPVPEERLKQIDPDFIGVKEVRILDYIVGLVKQGFPEERAAFYKELPNSKDFLDVVYKFFSNPEFVQFSIREPFAVSAEGACHSEYIPMPETERAVYIEHIMKNISGRVNNPVIREFVSTSMAVREHIVAGDKSRTLKFFKGENLGDDSLVQLDFTESDSLTLNIFNPGTSKLPVLSQKNSTFFHESDHCLELSLKLSNDCTYIFNREELLGSSFAMELLLPNYRNPTISDEQIENLKSLITSLETTEGIGKAEEELFVSSIYYHAGNLDHDKLKKQPDGSTLDYLTKELINEALLGFYHGNDTEIFETPGVIFREGVLYLNPFSEFNRNISEGLYPRWSHLSAGVMSSASYIASKLELGNRYPIKTIQTIEVLCQSFIKDTDFNQPTERALRTLFTLFGHDFDEFMKKRQ